MARRQNPLSWDLDRLPPERLEKVYALMAEFADRLRSWGEPVPSCWYAAGHQVHRFAILMYWHERVHREARTLLTQDDPPREVLDPAPAARDAAEWWGSPWGLPGMRGVWAPCETGREEHAGTATPTLTEAVRAHAAANRVRRR